MAKTTFVKHGIVIPVDGNQTVYEDGGVVYEGNRILDVGPTDSLAEKYDCDETISARNKVVVPGFVNLHLHSGFIRGLAEDLPVFEWLKNHVDPTHKALRREDAPSAYRLCYAEMAKAGITCALDMYRYMDHAAEVAREFGVRVTLAPYVATRSEYDYFESLEDNQALVESHHRTANNRIRVWFGLEHLTYCTEESYRRVADLADEYGVGIHTHGEESREMVNQLTEQYGKRPVEVLRDRGILAPPAVLAHCVWLDETEIEILASTNTGVAHCPTSNMKLASGVAPLIELQDHGVNVGLGSDGIKENNRIDLLQEMKLAALLQKVHHLDATVVPAMEVLRAATIDGAAALGLEDEIGSLEPGKKADLVLIDLDTLHQSPQLGTKNVVPNLVHSAVPSDVDTVIVDGKRIVQTGTFLPADEQQLINDHTRTTRTILQRRDGNGPG